MCFQQNSAMKMVDYKKSVKEKIAGMVKGRYNKLAAEYAKTFILFWEIGGIIYALISGKMSLIMFFSITFLSLILLIPIMAGLFWIETKKNLILEKWKSGNGAIGDIALRLRLKKKKNIAVLVLFTIWNVVDFVAPIILAIIFVNILHEFIN